MNEQTGSYIEKQHFKFTRFSLIKKKNKTLLNTSKDQDKDKNHYKNKNPSFINLTSLKNKIPKKNGSNNSLGVVSLFGNHYRNNPTSILNRSGINNNNINYNLYSSYIHNSNIDISDALEQELNLKFVENELINKLKDMTVVMSNKQISKMRRDTLGMSPIHKKHNVKKKKSIEKKVEKNNKVKLEGEDKDRRVIRKKPLYDSLDEDENQLEDDSDLIFINPEERFIYVFDTIILISSFICFIYIPIQISISKCFCINEHFLIKIVLLLIDVIYIIDFFISFFRAYYNYEYKLIKEIKLIVKNYLAGNFFFDLLQSIPFNVIIIYLCSQEKKYHPDGAFCLYNGINGVFISIKIFSGLKIMKVLKVMNTKKNKAYLWLQEIDDVFYEKLLSVFSFTFLCLASMNLFICLHIFIAEQSYPNWLITMGIQDLSFFKIYIAALYGIIETLTTVGYGDVTCDSFTEICFQIILLSVGIVAYSWLITMIGNYVKNESKAEIKHSKDLTLLEEIRVEFPKMPFKLYNKIHQHLKSVSNQQKKIDLNILVNSLPYSVKNMVIFRVYNQCIRKFNFFKKCENTDFISRVLTNFIPLFSKQKAILIREGEIIENIVFVRTGKLTLDAILDASFPEESIKKYIYEKFEDIEDNENKPDKTIRSINKSMTRSVTRSNISPQHSNQFERVKTGIQNIFNQKDQTQAQSYHESHIEQEIAKCDLGGSDGDFEDEDFKVLHIMQIKRNEYFGITYMFLNKPSPLSLRVKSKKADLYLLRKNDAVAISKAYPSIWKRISQNSMHNMIAIKNKAIDTLKNYCSCHGVIYDDYEPKETHKFDPLNMFEFKELMEIERMKKHEEQIIKSSNSKDSKDSKDKTKREKVSKKKSSKFKKRRSSTVVIEDKNNLLNFKNNIINKRNDKHLSSNLLLVNGPMVEQSNTMKVKSTNSINFTRKSEQINIENMKLSKLTENKDEKSVNEYKEYETLENNKNVQDTLKLNYNDTKKDELIFSELKEDNNNNNKNEDEDEDEDEEEEKEEEEVEDKIIKVKEEEKNKGKDTNTNISNDEFEKTNLIIGSKNDISYPNTLSNLPPQFASLIKKKIIRKKIKNKKYYKIMCLKLIETLNNFIRNHPNNNMKNDDENFNNNIISINNYNSPTFKNFNYLISNANVIYPFSDDINKSLISSFSKLEKCTYFSSDKLFISKNDSFECKSIYKNINKITNGKYGKNKIMQKDTEDFVLCYSKDINNFSKFFSKVNLIKINMDEKYNNSLSQLIGNLSEIKSNKSNNKINDSENSEIKLEITTKNINNKKSTKKLDNKKIKRKIKKTKTQKVTNYNIIDDDILSRKSSLNKENNSILESSENIIIKHKKTKGINNDIKAINFGKSRSKTFIKKIFTKKKPKKENNKNNKSQSKEFLNEFNILNPQNGLKDSRNMKELKIKTLDKLKTNNKREVDKEKIDEDKNNNVNSEEGYKNCIIY